MRVHATRQKRDFFAVTRLNLKKNSKNYYRGPECYIAELGHYKGRSLPTVTVIIIKLYILKKTISLDFWAEAAVVQYEI